MFVFIQDEFVPEERATVSVFDRGFRYGDGLFEGVLVRHGKIFRSAQHWQRLERSACFLKISIPYSADELSAIAHELMARNESRDCVLRTQLSRGVGPRGYAPSGREKSCVVMSTHPAPVRDELAGTTWKLCTSSWRVAAGDPLANHKTCSRLLQVCAAIEARERNVDESLLLNTDGEVAEGGTSNVFWVQNGTVCTPPLAAGALPGVTRAVVLELCDALAIPHAERGIQAARLPQMEGVFLSLSSRGIVEAASLDGLSLPRSKLTMLLQKEFELLLERECPAA